MEFKHKPVLLEETINGLNIKQNGIYVDGTLGGAGHSKEILKQLSSKGLLVGIDRDEEALKAAKENLKEFQNVKYIHGNHDEIEEILEQIGIDKVDGILFDLGVSSAQFDESDRGFSYRFDAKLDMRMNQNNSLSAYQIVNEYSLNDLTRILRDYGEEKFAYQIARAIVQKRQVSPIETTFQLVDVIKSVLPCKVLNKVGHPAKQTFQAIRIEVNNELGVLVSALKQATDLLKPGGRCAVITFNSLEDRIVKNYFKSLASEENTSRKLPQIKQNIEFELVNRKVIIATEEEVERNNRAKPAKLRIIERK